LSALTDIKAATSIQNIAALLGYKASSVAYILYKLPMAAKYTTFHIPKKSGGFRQIDAPIGHVKNLQSQLARLLAQCRLEIETAGPKRKSLSHGFRKSHSIITNARPHKKLASGEDRTVVT
jgi:RNA-directed DNA polymerase